MVRADLQAFVDLCVAPCAVLAVTRAEDGGCGTVTIRCGNARYREVMGPAYYDDMPYEELVPKDLKFEDYCFRAAFLGERMHAYVQTNAFDTWTDLDLVPMVPESAEVGLCQFVFHYTQTADPARLATLSVDIASAVIRASIRLLSGDDFMQSVAEVMCDIREMSEASTCCVVLVDHERRECTLFAKSVADDADDLTRAHENIPYGVVRSWDEMIGESDCLIVRGQHDLARLTEANPSWARILEALGIESVVLTPFLREGESFGYLYITNFCTERMVEIKELVQLMSYIMGSEIENHLLVARLDEMSRFDVLTRLPNRRAMISRVNTIRDDRLRKPYGIISVDLNGLKVVNDNAGHDAGDTLLVHAAEILREEFYEGDAFRTGGDEFIVVCYGVERDVFHRKLKSLREAFARDDDISAAMGAYWTNGSMEPRQVFMKADEQMYVDKRAFYARHPGLRVR